MEAILAVIIVAAAFLAIFGLITVYCYMNALNVNRRSQRV